MTAARLLAVSLALVAAAATVGATGVPPAGADATAGHPSSLAAAVATAGGLSSSSAAADGTRVVHAGETLALQSGPGQPVRGRTDLPPGTELTVRVRSTDADHPYLRSTTATVGEGGGFRGVFDLSEVPPGTALSVVVHRGGENLTTATAEVVECTTACAATTPHLASAVLLQEDLSALTARPGQVVRGRTNLPPGTEVRVQLLSSGSTASFVESRRAVVDANGTFRAVFDFGSVSTTVGVSAAVFYNGTRLTMVGGTLECAECGPTPTPAPAEEYADADLGVVQVANGSVAHVRVVLGDADAGTLAVVGPATGYALNLTVRDRTGDGEVVVLLDTAAAAGDGPSVRTADPGDGFRVNEERGTFVATEYRLVLHPVRDGSATVATGLLVVTQDGPAGTPLPPTPGPPVPLAGVAALLSGAVLAVAGLGVLLGLFDPLDLVGGR